MLFAHTDEPLLHVNFGSFQENQVGMRYSWLSNDHKMKIRGAVGLESTVETSISSKVGSRWKWAEPLPLMGGGGSSPVHPDVHSQLGMSRKLPSHV